GHHRAAGARRRGCHPAAAALAQGRGRGDAVGGRDARGLHPAGDRRAPLRAAQPSYPGDRRRRRRGPARADLQDRRQAAPPRVTRPPGRQAALHRHRDGRRRQLGRGDAALHPPQAL
ncbi:MAG: hypothetical protein AVDCRST_MAG40-635, partial [uncultured Gemmatimonadaceae bacterium]